LVEGVVKLAEYSEYLCMDCGIKLTSYYPRGIESFLKITDEEFDRDKATYRCNQCEKIYQIERSPHPDGDGCTVFDIHIFIIQKEDEKDGPNHSQIEQNRRIMLRMKNYKDFLQTIFVLR
jgi:DNA-directed RNA polymerase subunit RPC12/RpoP